MNEENPGVVTLAPHPNGSDGREAQPSSAESSPTIAVVADSPPAVLEQPAVVLPKGPPVEVTSGAGVRSRRRRWLVPVAIGVAGLTVSGALGGLLLSTIGQRDAARHQLVVTQASLGSQLRAVQADLAGRQVTSSYERLVIRDSGRAVTDYETIVACKAYSDCRSAAQQLLEDLQAFQSDRSGAAVPAALQSADAALGDSISAGIAGQQEFITGIDDNNDSKATDGGKKVDQAMLSIGKAETALADALK